MAHFALQKLHIRPKELEEMDDKEKAFVYASIQIRAEEEKKESQKITAKGGRH